MGWVEEIRGLVAVTLPSGEKILARRIAKYAEGWRWCSVCSLAFFSAKGLCPICGRSLRTGARMRRRRRKNQRVET